MKRIWALLLAAALLLSMTPVTAEEEMGEAVFEGVVELEEGAELTEDELPAPFTDWVPDRKPIGPDDRVTVDSREYPYCAVAYLEASAPCGCSWTGTGFMVGPSGLVTAGHCLFCEEHNQNIDRLTLYFGYKAAGTYAYKYNDGTSYWYHYDQSSGSDDLDYGYVKLRSRMGDKVGWFGMSARSDSDINSQYFYAAGYKNGVIKRDYDRAKVINPHEISHTIDTEPGYSGCPIYTPDFYVVAINVAHDIYREVNYGCRVTSDMIREMRSKGMFD